jgi:hypothetical protein
MRNKELSIRRIESILNKINRLRMELSYKNFENSQNIVLEIKELTEDLQSIIEREN